MIAPGAAVAVVVARRGQVPLGADEATAEAGGRVLVVGERAELAVGELTSADELWWWDSGPGLAPAALAATLGPWLAATTAVILPSSPDGRDLAPRLAVTLGWPLLAQATEVGVSEDGRVEAVLIRLDGRIEVPVVVDGPAVATLVPGVRSVVTADKPRLMTRMGGKPPTVTSVGRTRPPRTEEETSASEGAGIDPVVEAVIEADPSTMDLSDARRVLGGGAGLAPVGTSEAQAAAAFELLADVAARIGASAGATRVVTDAGWMSYDRQIGTTGITVNPELYVAFGISGATQHTGGLGSPAHVVSLNTDASCPMTSLADLGLVSDARAVLVALADRLGVAIPEALGDTSATLSPTGAPA